MQTHILYVEDDLSLSFVTRDNLEEKGYKVTYAENGKVGLQLFQEDVFDICIFDVMMPEMDGFTLAEEVRKRNQEVPILFLTAKSLKEDKIQGLKIGADDYITKPFSIEELLLRIEVFLKRRKVQIDISTPGADKLYIGAFEFNYPNLSLTINEDARTLTQKEADLLRMFLLHPNEVLKRAEILEQLWGEDDYFLGRSMDVFISRLRKYLKADPRIKIENIHGVGFKLRVEN